MEGRENNEVMKKGRVLVESALANRIKKTVGRIAGEEFAGKIPSNEFQKVAEKLSTSMDFSDCKTESDAEEQVDIFWGTGEGDKGEIVKEAWDIFHAHPEWHDPI